MNVKSLVPEPVKDVIRTIIRLRSNNDSYVRHRYLRYDLVMNMRDSLARGWYDKDWLEHERREFAALERYSLPEDGLAFNLGAHHGLISMLIKKRLLPHGRVVAVEIDRINSEICRANISKNKISGIECINAAISCSDAFVQYKGTSNSNVDTKPSVLKSIFGMKVKGMTIDNMCSKYGFPVLIYMDIEGAEVLAVRGARRALQQVKIWFIELHGDHTCSKYGGLNAEVVSALSGNGYSICLSEEEYKDFKPMNSIKDIPSDRCYIIASK